MCLQRILQVLETAFFKCAWYILFPWPSSTKISISHVLWSTQWRFAKYLRGPGNCTLKMCLIFFIPSAVVNKNLNSFYTLYRGDDNSLDRPEGKQANASFSMAWISLGALPYKKKTAMTARVSMLLKSRSSLACFDLVSFLVGLRTYQHPRTRVTCQGIDYTLPENDTKFSNYGRVW